MKITVDKNGNGDFNTITAAINSVDGAESAIIYIKNGTYAEKLVIDKPNITLIGEDIKSTVLTYGDGAFMPDSSGEPMGTFKTASVHITPEATGFMAYNLTFENSAGLGSDVGQAVALYLDCDEAVINNCCIIAKQDTLLTGPMFLDLEENPSILNRQFFKNCYIEGDVDFIFGGAVAVFEACEIYSLKRPTQLPCYVTAACTTDKRKYGYVFRNCTLTGSADDGMSYLGRPWREYANVVFIDCELDKCTSKKGFCRWNQTDRHLTAKYALYNCYGNGYCEADLEPWVKILTPQEAQNYSNDLIFGDWQCDVPSYEDLI